VLTAEQEKAQLRARYEQAENLSAGASNGAPVAASSSSSALPPLPMDMAPGYEELPHRPLNAAEEKARLAAQYAAEERAANSATQTPGYGPPGAMPASQPPPVMLDAQSPYGQPWQQPPPMQPRQSPAQPLPPQLYTQSSQPPYTLTGGSAPTQVTPQQSYMTPTPGNTMAGSNDTGSNISAPVAARPPMQVGFPSQASGMPTSSGYNNGNNYAQPQGQSHSGYYTTSPVHMSAGNADYGLGDVYAAGNGRGSGYGANFMNTDPYARNGDDATLNRDPSISQGKRRAVEASGSASPPPPPPLAPRPPAEYIHETEAIHASTPANELNWENQAGEQQQYNSSRGMENGVEFGLEVRPFSPLDLSFDQNNVPFERPPLPPKVPI